jgi:RNA polymerase sigma-70 factor (ECF subfamily)
VDSSADAADLLGDTLLVAWRRVRDIPTDPQRARMWLFVVARNVLANADRGRRRRERLAAKLGEELLARPLPPPDEDALAVREAVAALPPDLRELVRLVHWDGFSLAEAAKLTGTSASTARTRYSRARSLLAESLGLSQYSAVSP